MMIDKHVPPPSNLSTNFRAAGGGAARLIVYRLKGRERDRWWVKTGG